MGHGHSRGKPKGKASNITVWPLYYTVNRETEGRHEMGFVLNFEDPKLLF